MPERRTFETSGLTCEEWYGIGDPRCIPDYEATGNLSKDIESLEAQISRLRYESGRRDCYNVLGCQEDKKKQIDNLKIIIQEKQNQVKIIQKKTRN